MPSCSAAIVLMVALVLTHSAADAAAPQRLGLCAACHGEHGHAVDKTVPNLAGQNLDYLRAALKQYRSGARDVPAMRAAVGMLDAEESDQVLQWYAAQPGTLDSGAR